MESLIQIVVIGLTAIAGAVALPIMLVAWVRIIKYSLKAIHATKPDVNAWGVETLFNPFNLLLRPSLLTDEGRKYRRVVGKNILSFLMPLALVFLLASAGGLLK